PTATHPDLIKRIQYSREDHDYAAYLGGDLKGFYKTYHDAEVALDQLVYDLQHSGLPVCGDFAAGLARLYQKIFEPQPELDGGAPEAVEIVEPSEPATRHVSVGWDGAKHSDLACIAAQMLLPLAHLNPAISAKGNYLL